MPLHYFLLTESQKLYLNDCRRRQAALYPDFAFKSPSVRMLLETPNAGELLVFSGQSRLHLHLQQKRLPSELGSLNKGNDFVLFQTEEDVFPSFPTTIDEEASVFRTHGLPLLVWPDTRDLQELQKVWPFLTARLYLRSFYIVHYIFVIRKCCHRLSPVMRS
ncbi:hypothetical protein EG68_12094 [Paragonimus skrjabini miyazakii]|uniref:Uncharacterized protein n=1 Tax=Paragonimus skrjabini miyazakii TaxID=59628 RepID=A0A8S9YNW2_9TREM|nr:hypothetical protein EG68_12094 [Paragonimus skrjabini miyazakii]